MLAERDSRRIKRRRERLRLAWTHRLVPIGCSRTSTGFIKSFSLARGENFFSSLSFLFSFHFRRRDRTAGNSTRAGGTLLIRSALAREEERTAGGDERETRSGKKMSRHTSYLKGHAPTHAPRTRDEARRIARVHPAERIGLVASKRYLGAPGV